MERRDFLKKGTAAAGAVVTAGLVQAAGITGAAEDYCDCVNAPKLPRRAYGDTTSTRSCFPSTSQRSSRATSARG
ncbi:MAG: twin-arginine translocation signal domain-containing protein [Planctomycetes bacterium]|nr:twin-arginine translocation signal domain-containing protein [Planctomycetota bacterium]